ncbi:MAG: carboxypeptidase regulatory-like domain-containing protein [Sulfuritalea sp.]|nr:carboxypeptidase regulatory-like domain-containing protein [Sulfuritalea sp.]
MKTSIIHAGLLAVLCAIASHAYAKGPCDDIANAQQKQQCLKNEEQKSQQQAQQQAQLKAQQEAQRQAQLKAQQDAERLKQSAAQKKAPPPATAQGSVSGKLHKNSASGPALNGVSVTSGGKSTTTGKDGKFKLDGIGVGNTTIAFSKSGYEAYQGSVSVAAGRNSDMGERWLTEKATATPVRPPTTTTGSVSGKLHKTSASGPALDGVSVTAGGKSATTGKDGKFKLDGIAAGNTTIAFSRSGYVTYQGSVSIAAGKNADMGERWLAEKATSAPVQPPATAQGSISGKLHKTSASGPALDGVLVTAGGKSATTGKDGKFKLDGIAAGNTAIAFSRSGYDAYQGSVSVAAGKNSDMGERWLTEKATSAAPPPSATTKGSVSGRLHKNSASGPALDGVSVTAGGKSTTTGKDGKFKLDGIAAGNTAIAFSRSGYDAYQGNVSVAAGRNSDMGERWLTEKATSAAPPPSATAQGSVSGKLHKNSASGPALDGVSVTSGGKSTTTGKDGKFKLDGIAAGNTAIAFSRSGYEAYQGSVSVAAGRNSDMGERWLTEKATSAPVQPPVTTSGYVTVCGSSRSQRVAAQTAEIVQAVRGGYSFNEACRGHDACYVDCKTPKAACDKKFREDAERTCGSAKKGHERDCFADASIAFNLVSEEGDVPFRQARARCPANSASVSNAVGLGANMGERGRTENATAAAPPPPATAQGSVSGKLHKNSASGPALEGVSVTSGGKSATADKYGKFKLAGITAGNTTIAFSQSGYDAYQRNLTIVAGKNADMGNVWLTEKATPAPAQPPPTVTGSISGNLHKNAASGPPLDGVAVTAGSQRAITNSKGEFTLKGIAVGNTTIAFSRSGYEAYQRNLTIVAGKKADMGKVWLTENTPSINGNGDGNVVSTVPNLSSEGYSKLNPLVRVGFGGQCTAFAWGRAYEITGKRMDRVGNAKTWWDETKYPTGQTPRRGAIAVWQGDTFNPNGHVAIVEDVKSNGIIIINEANIKTYKNTKYGGGYDGKPKDLSLTNLKARGKGIGKLRGFIYLN